ncbi:MAG: wax ester/triacylglycerol synthase domain-containing protein, partial [Ilumatobacteraceae bacterium]
MTQPMGPLDALFLHVEDGITHMHIGSCSVFEGPAPSIGELTTLIESKLPLVTRYRQKVRFVPGGLGHPVWVDDAHFDIDYHVRHSALPAPGTADDLENLMGRLMSQELDRNRPLWEAWIVEGLPDGRWAMITKVHHCMVDGIS